MSKLKSRKFWMAVVTGLLIVLNDGLGLELPTEAIMTVAGVVIAYILGESGVDIARMKQNDPFRDV
jgi:uncharacterized membrane protein